MKIKKNALSLMMITNIFCYTFSFNVYAQDLDDCIKNSVKVNICEKAKEIQQGISSSLPMKINQNMTLYSILAIKTRISMNVIWHLTSSQLSIMLQSNGISKNNLIDKIDKQSFSTVCGQPVTAAFVRLGGEIQYNYTTQDGVVFTNSLVKQCPYN